MQQVRVAAKRKYTPAEKVRIVLEGFRQDGAVRDLCRREGIRPGAFYARTKDFIEAGKGRLTRDTVRDATCQETEQIKRENAAFRDYLHLVGIRHILAAPFNPQTNGKLGRYQQTIKREVNQVPHKLPSQLERALADFVNYHNLRRYHKALGDVTPADVLHGRREEILQRRKEVQAQTTQHRRDYNQTLREPLQIS